MKGMFTMNNSGIKLQGSDEIEIDDWGKVVPTSQFKLFFKRLLFGYNEDRVKDKQTETEESFYKEKTNQIRKQKAKIRELRASKNKSNSKDYNSNI